MGAHAPGCHLAVAFGDRLHDCLVFVPGSAEPFALAQLRAPEGVQAVAHGDRLFGKEAIAERKQIQVLLGEARKLLEGMK